MTRLTERETEEIRRAKRAVESDAQKQESRTRFADSTPTPEPTQDPALRVLMARHGRLAEIYRGGSSTRSFCPPSAPCASGGP